MIERIVLIKLKAEHASEKGRAEVVERTRAVLPEVPGVRGLSVGVPADERSAQSWDVAIRVTLDGVEALPAYLQHPDHRDYVDVFLRPRMECIKAWNFEPR